MSCNGDAMPLGPLHLPPDMRLPTLQRNALRKIFERHDFAPDEVFSLGYRRLHQAEGIGHKGMEIIIVWLKDYGFALQPPALPEAQVKKGAKKGRRDIDQALQLLQANGYVVRYPGEAIDY